MTMSGEQGQDVLVTTEWLAAHLHDANQRIVDCSWYLPELKRDARAEYAARHIAGAVYFDIEDISDHASPYAHMLPGAETFAAKVGALGIDNQTRVVVYDTNYVSARVWWMFRVFGHDNVVILDGGLTQWLAEGRPTAAGMERPAAKPFQASLRPQWVADWTEVAANIDARGAQLIDARMAKRYSGELPTGYPGIAGGHIPGSVNLPWDKFLDASSKRFAPASSLASLFTSAGVDPARPVITTCGSGVTACILALALHRLGHQQWKVYDGSWHEWAQRPQTPKVMPR